jgi:hypothetical protein
MGGYKNEGFVEVLAAQQSPENPNWFQVETLSFYFLCYQSFWQTNPESSGVIEKVK